MLNWCLDSYRDGEMVKEAIIRIIRFTPKNILKNIKKIFVLLNLKRVLCEPIFKEKENHKVICHEFVK